MTSLRPIDVSCAGPVACGAVLWRLDGTLRATVVLKAVFALVHEGLAAPLTATSADALAAADIHLGADPSRSIETAGDLAPRKARADVTFVGHAHAAPGRPTPASSVRLGISRDAILVDKTLHVYGDRTRAEPTARPFQKMPIVYERAHGGPTFGDNPVGVGADAGGALPNVVHPTEPTRPAGFAPLARSWPARRAVLRPEDVRCLDAPIAQLRADFPWAFFQSAPPDQRIDFLRGDEWILLDGLHPSLPRLQTRLPSVRASASLQRRGTPAVEAIPLVADTLAIDGDRQCCSIVWRGDFAVPEGEAGLPLLEVRGRLEIAGVPLGGVEPRPARAPAASPAPTGAEPAMPRAQTALVSPQLQMLLDMRPAVPFAAGTGRAGLQAAPSAVRDSVARPAAAAPPSEPAPPRVQTALISPEEQDRLDRLLATPWGERASSSRATCASAKPSLADLPFAPPAVTAPPVATPPATAALTSVAAPQPSSASAPQAVSASASASAAAPPTGVRAQVLARLAAGEGLSGLDLVKADLADIDFSGRMLSGLDLRGARLARCDLTRARLADAKLEGADLSGATLSFADLCRADLTRANLTRARLDAASLRDAVFTGAQGGEADLSGASGERASFAKGRWEGAVFRGASLAHADFSGAALKGASLVDASLVEARFGDARAGEATFDGATLERARFDGAVLVKSSLRRVEAKQSMWERATLGEATFADANLEGANLSRTICGRASFVRANLAGATLRQAEADGADLSESRLDGADLRQAQALGAIFDGSSLLRAQAERADLSGSRFTRADLRDAILRPVRLARADLSGTRLDGADLRDADLEGAILTGASRKGAKLNGARLKDVVDDPANGGET